MATVKVKYFDLEGAAEKIRLTLAMCNKDFEDIRVDHSKDWGSMKEDMPYGQLPVLEVTETDGTTKVHAQSPAILKWIARTYDTTGTLYPTEADKMIKVEEMMGLSDDLGKVFMPSLYLGYDHTKFGFPAEWDDKAATMKKVQEKFLNDDLPRFMKFFSEAIENNGYQFITGENVTIVDLQVLPQLRMLGSGWAAQIPTDFVEEYRTVKKWMDRMYAIPQIKKWYKMEDLTVKLTYFDIAGAAEKVRLALVMCDKTFEDERIDFQAWGALKETMPYGQLPVMNVTHEKSGQKQLFTQSSAMLRWVVQKFDYSGKLYSSEPTKMMKIEEVIGLSDDMAKAWMPCLYLSMRHEIFGYPKEWPEKAEVVQSMREKFLANDLPRFMNYFSGALEKSGGDFFTGEDVTIADLQILAQLKYFTLGVADHVPADCLEAYPTVTKWMSRMYEIPQIKKWYNM